MKLNHVQVELLRAKELISDESRWAQKAYALNAHGGITPPASDAACRWCLVGSLMAVGAGQLAYDTLVLASGGEPVLKNDEQSHPTVMGIMDYAIELAGKRGSCAD